MRHAARFLAILSTLPLALALQACGTASSSDPALAALVANAPTSSTIDLEVGGASNTVALPYGAAPATDVTPTSPTAAMTATIGELCHPHLFQRTAQVTWTLNALFRRHLRHVEALIAHHPSLQAGDSAAWTDAGAGLEVQRRFTISRSADGATYTFELDLAPAGQTPPLWVKVFDGTQTSSVTGAIHERTGALHFDYDALHGVLPLERVTGTVDLAFDLVRDPARPAPGVKRTSDVTFTGFSFGPLDPHGPRAGTFHHLSEPGLGGTMSFQDQVVLLCPANPGGLSADTATVSRWYRAADGSVHGRADATASGGQIPAGDTWMGLACHTGLMGADPATASPAVYWMMKLEDAAGATVAGSAFQAGAGAAACDAAFGPTPSLTDSTTDFDFASPVTFPNAW